MTQEHRIRVFSTDDHPIVTTGVAAILKNDPCKELVGIAHSADEMFGLLGQTRPEVLLLDLNMPGSDYYQNIRQLKKEFSYIRILIYSAYQAPGLPRSLLNEGIEGYVLKSVLPEELLTAIELVYQGQIYFSTGIIGPQTKTANGCRGNTMLKDDFLKSLSLSPREQEVLQLISRGFTSQLIGETLFISKYTVETHRKNILRKLDFNSSTELVKFAVQQGLV